MDKKCATVGGRAGDPDSPYNYSLIPLVSEFEGRRQASHSTVNVLQLKDLGTRCAIYNIQGRHETLCDALQGLTSFKETSSIIWCYGNENSRLRSGLLGLTTTVNRFRFTNVLRELHPSPEHEAPITNHDNATLPLDCSQTIKSLFKL
ncbi:hypothetical protein EDD18DRAFT_1109325 [Armillaria luteobubalina]|uniref:Uncharacterized protein n=1 Tax=Armillaria luteobubalina TaxID=153913 RepID=A0AA39PWL3_9AGAR|nr:hypothetical protein EDD18DRAFT_1109325 [Armillaria luteobubalina]